MESHHHIDEADGDVDLDDREHSSCTQKSISLRSFASSSSHGRIHQQGILSNHSQNASGTVESSLRHVENSNHTCSSSASSSLVRMGKVAMSPWMTTMTTTTITKEQQEQEYQSLTSSPPQPERIMKIGSSPTPIPGEEYNSNTHIAPIFFSQQQPQHPKSLLGRREINNNPDVHPNDDENSSSSSSSQHHDWVSSDRNDENGHNHDDYKDLDSSLVEHRKLEVRGGNAQLTTRTAPTSNLQQPLLKSVTRRPNSPPPPQLPPPLNGDTALLVDNTDRGITIQEKAGIVESFKNSER
jgi:hypothetical protein